MIGDYTKFEEKTKFKCCACGYEFFTRRGCILNRKNCPRCDKVKIHMRNKSSISIRDANPDFAKFLINESDCDIYPSKSYEKLEWKCKLCEKTFINSPNYVLKHDVFCHSCSDGYSLPNKYFYNFLIETKIDFEIEKKFSWSDFGKNKHFRYDFFIKSKNTIIEVMGEQHYPECSSFFLHMKKYTIQI